MESQQFVFEIIPAESESSVARHLQQEIPIFPSGRIILFFSLMFSLVGHLMLFGWRLHH